MKKIGISIGVFAALAIAFAGAPDVNAAGGDWGTGANEATSLPCATTGSDLTGDTCNGEYKLTSDITLSAALTRYNGADTNITIDLNGHSITSSGSIALVNGPTLTIKDSVGNGYIKSTNGTMGTIYVQIGHFAIEGGTLISTVANNGGIIWAKGSSANVANATSITVGKDAVLKYETPGYGYGVEIDKTNTNDSYGVNVKIDGSVEGGVYVHGNIQHKDNEPQITIGSTAVLKGVGLSYPAVYAAGYANWVFEDGATVTGEGSALAIKSGKVTINGGTYTATGADTTPTSGFSNGVNASGATIQIESNASYAGEVELTINGGTFVSDNGRVFYEYLDASAANTAVSSITINDGTFLAETAGKDVFMVSQEFANTITGFVHGGVFSSDPTAFASEGTVFARNDDETFTKADPSKPSDNGNEDTKNPETNPGTSDNVLLYTALGLIGLVGLGGSVVLLNKKS